LNLKDQFPAECLLKKGIYSPEDKKCYVAQRCNKIIFYKFDFTAFLEENLAYPGSTLTLRFWLLGCASPTTKIEIELKSSAEPDFCTQGQNMSGTITVNVVTCAWSAENNAENPTLTYEQLRSLEVAGTPVAIGKVKITPRRDMWIEVPLDLNEVKKQAAREATGELCLQVVADSSLHQTMIIFGGITSKAKLVVPMSYQLLSTSCKLPLCDPALLPRPEFQRAGYPEKPHAQLVLVQGRAFNCTGEGCSEDCSGNRGDNIYSDACTGTVWDCRDEIMPTGYNPNNCSALPKVAIQNQLRWTPSPGACILRVSRGTTRRDRTVQVQGTIDALNVLLGDVLYSSPSTLSSESSIDNMTVTVNDTTARYDGLPQGGWFDVGEFESYVGISRTVLDIIPAQSRNIALDMLPVYSEAWLQRRLETGRLPVFVMLEDCGNRPMEDCEDCESDCQSFLSLSPAKLPGESGDGQVP
jgi:hypothetical protein